MRDLLACGDLAIREGVARTASDAHQWHGAQLVERRNAELPAEHGARIVHLLRDGAVGQHLPEGIDGAAMHDGQARFGILLPHGLADRPVLQAPL
ncbi:Uncharacterised protein [Roseomonas gilardii subsp. rosea]|nr:Uncharacterised protein [Roseomonas gilardii subsp. rosea]